MTMLDKENKPNHDFRNDLPSACHQFDYCEANACTLKQITRFESNGQKCQTSNTDCGTNAVEPEIQSSTLRIIGTIAEERNRSQKRVELIRKMRRLKEDSIDQWKDKPIFAPIQVRNIGIQTDAVEFIDTQNDEIRIYKNKADVFLMELAKAKAEVLKVRSQLSIYEKKLQANKDEFRRLSSKDDRQTIYSKETSSSAPFARNFFGNFCASHARHLFDMKQRSAAIPKSMECSRERGRDHIQKTWNQSSGRVVPVEKETIHSIAVVAKNSPSSFKENTFKTSTRVQSKADPPKADLSDDVLVLQLMHLVHGLSVGVDLSLHLFLKQGTYGWTLRSAKVETVPGD
jgi:hypothetical protein